MIKNVKCTYCGYKSQTEDNPFYICNACGKENVMRQAEKFSYKNELPEAEQIEYLRLNLSKSIQSGNHNQMVSFSNDILKLIPDDFKGSYYNAYALNEMSSPTEIKQFYSLPYTEVSQDDMHEIMDHIIHYSDLRHKKLVIAFIKTFDESYLPLYDKVFNERRKKEDEHYLQIDRDVFICHRSENKDIAKKIVETLEKENFKCWVSFRNIRKDDNRNYWEEIEDSIKMTEIFLVVSDSDVALSKDVQREFKLAEKYKKKRVEFKIDGQDHGPLLEQFFDKHGLKWIDAHVSLDKGLDELKHRIAEVIISNKDENEGKIDENNRIIGVDDVFINLNDDGQKPPKINSILDGYEKHRGNIVSPPINIDTFGRYDDGPMNVSSKIVMPFYIVLDHSGSMGESIQTSKGSPKKIQELNKNMLNMIEEIKQSPRASKLSEMTIIACGAYEPTIMIQHENIQNVHYKPLQSTGNTPLGQSVEIALGLIEQRKVYYDAQNIENYKPALIIMSDGVPTDEYKHIAKRCADLALKKKIKVYAFGIGDSFDFEKLNLFTPINPTIKIFDAKSFATLFSSISRSASDVSRIDEYMNMKL